MPGRDREQDGELSEGSENPTLPRVGSGGAGPAVFEWQEGKGQGFQGRL